MPDLQPACAQVVRLLPSTREDQLDAPTPPAGTPVAALLGHLLGVGPLLAGAARRSTRPADGGCCGARAPGAGHLDPAWRTLLPVRLTDLALAWRCPAAWQGVVRVQGTAVPAEVVGALALAELVLHGWDLARATGQPFRCDPASAQAVLALATAAARTGAATVPGGLFGPVVPVAPGAGALDRALSLAGRDPTWVPPSLQRPT